VAHRVGAKTIAVGHHADDQVETVLMHFLRGSGLAGLRGMLPVMPLADYRLIEPTISCQLSAISHQPSDLVLVRPLLEVTRAEIEVYCREHGLEPRFDLSNLDQTYYRNRLRHELIPLLESYNPAVRHIVRRSAQVIADDYACLHRQTLDAWAQVVSAESGESIVFDLARWRALPTSLKRGTLREAIHRLRRSLRNINWVHVEDALRALESKATSTQVTLPQGLMLTIGYTWFTVADEGYVPPTDLPQLAVASLPLTVPGVTPLPGSDWQVVAEVGMPGGEQTEALRQAQGRLLRQAQDRLWQALLDLDRAGPELHLRCRRPGDRFQPLGMGGQEKLLREFMINARVPQAARDRLPLVASPVHVVWVPGYRLDERVKVTTATQRVLRLRFVRPHQT
jgi:tRNA(Ile)-lysidine synthase